MIWAILTYQHVYAIMEIQIERFGKLDNKKTLATLHLEALGRAVQS